jgi:hypothetical protein
MSDCITVNGFSDSCHSFSDSQNADNVFAVFRKNRTVLSLEFAGLGYNRQNVCSSSVVYNADSRFVKKGNKNCTLEIRMFFRYS